MQIFYNKYFCRQCSNATFNGKPVVTDAYQKVSFLCLVNSSNGVARDKIFESRGTEQQPLHNFDYGGSNFNTVKCITLSTSVMIY